MHPDSYCLEEELADQCWEGKLYKREEEGLLQQAAPQTSSNGKSRPTEGHLGRLRAWGITGLQLSHFNLMLFSTLFKCVYVGR